MIPQKLGQRCLEFGARHDPIDEAVRENRFGALQIGRNGPADGLGNDAGTRKPTVAFGSAMIMSPNAAKLP